MLVETRGDITHITKTVSGNSYTLTLDTRSWQRFKNTAIYISVQRTRPYAMLYIEGKLQYLHRVLLNQFSELHVDHYNRNTLDCRVDNLRVCTQAENNQNSSLRKDNISGVRGVCWDTGTGMWLAQAQVNKQKHFLGRHTTLDAAELAVIAFRKAYMPFSNETEVAK